MKGAVHAIVQARMESTRLPRKVFEEIEGKPMLWHVVHRLGFAKSLQGVVLAVPDTRENDALEEFCRAQGIPCFRGPEDDVLSRYYGAAKAFGSSTIVRVTSDCPCVDPSLVDTLVEYAKERKADYAELDVEESFPRGVDAEVFSMRALELAHQGAERPYEREHVTPYLYERQDRFSVHRLEAPADLRRPDIRLTVDTREDLELVRAVYGELYDSSAPFLLRDVISLLKKRPELLERNAQVQQKNYKQ